MQRVLIYCSIAASILIAFSLHTAGAETGKVPVPVRASKPIPPLPEKKVPLTPAQRKQLAKKSEPLAKVLFSKKASAANLAPRAIGW